MVDSIDSSAVCGPLQFFRSMHPAHFTGSDAAFDGFIKLQFERFRQTVAETVLTFLPLSYLSSFVYVFKLHRFSPYFQEVHSWRMLTKLQQGRQSRVGQSFAIELIKDFMKASGSGKLVESVKT